jgi:cell fate regulator YaaT (PSP1 superfamily)
MVGSLVHAKRKAKRLSNEEIPSILRFADESDLKKIDACLASERQAFSVCKTRIESFELPMDLVEAEWQFDHRKLTFYFTADGRVDFRALVRDLAAIFNTRIELRQIPVRDAAKRLGGMGVCGRELCCSTYLGQYEHITLDHARIQQIPPNPSKLSGQCGRLKCCLLFEIDTYVEGMKKFPPLESTITTERGTGVIQKIDLFRESLYVHHAGVSEWEMLTLEEYNNLPRDQARSNGEATDGETSIAEGVDDEVDGTGTGASAELPSGRTEGGGGGQSRRTGKAGGRGGSEIERSE